MRMAMQVMIRKVLIYHSLLSFSVYITIILIDLRSKAIGITGGGEQESVFPKKCKEKEDGNSYPISNILQDCDPKFCHRREK